MTIPEPPKKIELLAAEGDSEWDDERLRHQQRPKAPRKQSFSTLNSTLRMQKAEVCSNLSQFDGREPPASLSDWIDCG
jgi:hypothetical protein